MPNVLTPPARVAGFVRTLGGLFAPASVAGSVAKRPDRRGYQTIFAAEQAWPGGAVRVPLKLRRRFVDACYDAKVTEGVARQRARHLFATWARATGQPSPPYAAEAIAAGPGALEAVKPGSRTAGDAKIARAVKAQAAAAEQRLAERAARSEVYRKAADDALGAIDAAKAKPVRVP